jgi:hypothetical protein
MTEGLPLRFAIRKPTDDPKRFERQQHYLTDKFAGSLAMTYFGTGSELLANLHRGNWEEQHQ